MHEKLGSRLREKAITKFAGAKSVASTAIKQFLESPDMKAEDLRQQELVEARRLALENPSYATLLANSDYQKWHKGELEDARIGLEPNAVFEAVQSGKPYSKFMYDAWKEAAVDPTISEAALHQKSVEYCSGTAQTFVNIATRVAESFATGQPGDDIQHMKDAIADLMGTSYEDRDDTIFKDQSWSSSYYRPDFAVLGVTPDELSVPPQKVMAGVGLCIGLWIRLADAGAARPVSGHSFGPALNHCSFLSLARDSGWTESTNTDSLLLEAHREAFLHHGNETEKQDQLFEPFRQPQFFEETLAVLSSSV